MFENFLTKSEVSVMSGSMEKVGEPLSMISVFWPSLLIALLKMGQQRKSLADIYCLTKGIHDENSVV